MWGLRMCPAEAALSRYQNLTYGRDTESHHAANVPHLENKCRHELDCTLIA